MKVAGKIALFIVFAAVSVPSAFTEAQAARGDTEAVHRATGKSRCVDCHSWLPFENAPLSFRDESERICAGCHASFHGRSESFSHPLNIRPSMAVPKDMPLDAKGRITCITCHKFHAGYKDADGNKLFFLRRTSGKAFCYSCHRNRLF